MTLLRSLIIGGLAVLIARGLCALLADGRPRVRRFAWALLLGPYLVPVLITGYAYASFSLSLIHHPVFNTIFYSTLLCWKFTPVAAVILYFTPAPISREAVHCWRLAHGRGSRVEERVFPREPGNIERRTRVSEWAFLLRAGCARGSMAAFAVVFLFVFAEFEMASLMGVKSWTVSLFDAHAGGLAVSESVRRMLWPLFCEAVAVATAITVLGRHRVIPVRRPVGNAHWLAWVYLAIAFVFVLLVPAGMVLWGTVRGSKLLLENFVLGHEIVSSLLFAAGATTVASLAAAFGRRLGKAVLFIALCLGLLGPLVLSLAVLAAVQLPGLISLRDTPVPLVLTLGLVLFPFALVLKRVLELTGYRSALHMTRLMEKSRPARELTWRLSTSGKFWAVLVLFVWAYWDLTASAILAPIGMTPVTVRLYNLMHYGQIAVLSALTCATFAAPIVIFLLAWGTRRWWAPR